MVGRSVWVRLCYKDEQRHLDLMVPPGSENALQVALPERFEDETSKSFGFIGVFQDLGHPFQAKKHSLRRHSHHAMATDAATTEPPSYEERCKAVNGISQPLASKKSTKKVHKLVRKAATAKHIRRGVKEVVKALRKGETGLAILAGDIYPIDVVSHLPVFLEEQNVPYIFVPSKFDLGAAASTKRPTSCVLIKAPVKDKEFDGIDIYETLTKEAKEFDPTSIKR